MSRRCQITGKGVLTGNNVSHANNRTRRRFLPNLQEASLLSDVLGSRFGCGCHPRDPHHRAEGRHRRLPARHPRRKPFGGRQGPEAPAAARPGEADGQPSRLSLTVRQAIGLAAERLRQAGVDNPRLEARLLLAHAHGTTPAALLRDPVAPADMASLAPLLARREAHEPLALIVGRREFWSLEFAVSPATSDPAPRVGNAGRGGCRGIRPPRATATGAGPGHRHRLPVIGRAVGVSGRVRDRHRPLRRGRGAGRAQCRGAAFGRSCAAFVCGDWADALDARFDLVLCNPPYIRTGDLGGLMPEVAHYEPHAALDGGADGFVAYRRVFPLFPRLLTQSGIAVVRTRRRPGGDGRRTGTPGRPRHRTAARPGRNSARPCAAARAAMKKPFGRMVSGGLASISAGRAAQWLAPGALADGRFGRWSGYSPEPVPID